MNTGQKHRRKEAYTELFDVLADETRRRIIRILRGWSGAISEQHLAERLAAMESDSEETPPETAESLLVGLHHVQLPKLVQNELIEWDRAAQTVSVTDHSLDEIDRLEEKISTNGWGPIASALADGRRRKALAIIESENGPIAREDLVQKLVSLETSEQRAETLIEKVTVQFHNHHLPKLEEVGLVEYDIGEATVEYEGPSTLTTVLPEAQ